MRSELRLAGAVLALCLGSHALAANDQPRHYAALATVTVSGKDGLQRLELPLPVLQASRSDDYADVRLFDAGGTPLPLAWGGTQPSPEPARRGIALPRFAWPSTPPGPSPSDARIEINAAGAVVRVFGAKTAPQVATAPTRWLLDLTGLAREGNDEHWQRIALDWPRRDSGLSTTVRVEASDDARQWRWVTQTALLELGSAGESLAQKHIDWPATAGKPRYLRLQFDAPLALTASEMVLSASPVRAALASQRMAFRADGDARAWTLDLQGRVPLARIQVQLPMPNSVLALRLEQRNDDKLPWQYVASFVAWRLSRDAQEWASPALDLTPLAARHWRLIADPRTPLPPVTTLDATLEWHAPVVVFAAREAQGLQLAVGREKGAAAALPLSTLIPGYQSGAEFKLPLASLGTLAPQTVATPGLPERLRDASPEDQRRWLLWVVLGAAVAGLAVLAMRLARDLKKP
jgi:hypothetical protein